MKLNTIKEMMRAGDLREAEAALREYLKADAGSTRAKVLLGVCLHLGPLGLTGNSPMGAKRVRRSGNSMR